MISSRAGCLYLPITKAANTSIKAALLAHDLGEPLPEGTKVHAWGAAELVPWDAAYDFSGFRFTFARNPFARTYSCYKNKILPEPTTRDSYVEGVHVSFRRYRRFRAGMSFGEFVKQISRISDDQADIHFVSQRAFLVGPKGLRVDYVGKVERMSEQWPEVCKVIGAELELPHLNKTTTQAHAEHYDSTSRRLVERRYEEDLALLGYSFLD